MRYFALVLCSMGCLDVPDTVRIAPYLVEAVQVSRAEPGAACRPLGAVDGSSASDCEARYESAYSTLRAHAALRGGNYVVIDAVTAAHLPGEDSTLTIDGRVYACPLGGYLGGPQISTREADPQLSER